MPGSPSHLPSRLEDFAQTIASASDADLAAWQVSGLVDSRSPARVMVRGIAGLALVVGAAVSAVVAWYIVPPLLALAAELLARSGRRLGGAETPVALAGLILLMVGGTAAFVTFHVLSRAMFARLGRPRM